MLSILLPPALPGLKLGEPQVRVLPFITLGGWLRISGMRWLRIFGTQIRDGDFFINWPPDSKLWPVNKPEKHQYEATWWSIELREGWSVRDDPECATFASADLKGCCN